MGLISTTYDVYADYKCADHPTRVIIAGSFSKLPVCRRGTVHIQTGHTHALSLEVRVYWLTCTRHTCPEIHMYALHVRRVHLPLQRRAAISCGRTLGTLRRPRVKEGDSPCRSLLLPFRGRCSDGPPSRSVHRGTRCRTRHTE